MFLNKSAVTVWCLSMMGGATAFSSSSSSSSTPVAFVGRQAAPAAALTTGPQHRAGCSCAGCSSFSFTRLFADAVTEESVDTEDVPEEVAALDGVESGEEAHNVERPARQQLKKKKGNQGKPLSEFQVGSTVKGTVKSIATYGAFVDIGATTDGLLHVSQLSTGFVSEVGEVLSEKQEVDVRIIRIDEDKNQVGLSLMTAEEEEASNEAQQASRKPRRQQNNRRDDSATLSSLAEKGWDSSVMVEGTVVSTVDFGCFVRIDASALNAECEGEFDGLVHVSAMSTQRVGRVTDVVSPDDKVQVRVNSIDGNKVSLTMLSVEDEAAKAEAAQSQFGSDGPMEVEGAKDWKQILVKMSDEEMPTFTNSIIIESRK